MQICNIKKASFAGIIALGILCSSTPTTVSAITMPQPQDWFTKQNMLRTAMATTLTHFILLMCKESEPDHKYKAHFDTDKLTSAAKNAQVSDTLAQLYHFWNEKILGQRLKEATLKPSVNDEVIFIKNKTCKPRGFFGLLLTYSMGVYKGYGAFEKVVKLPSKINKLVDQFQNRSFDDFIWGRVPFGDGNPTVINVNCPHRN